MTTQILSIISYIDELISLYPPKVVAIVGAGSGQSSWVQAFMARPIPKVIAIDADENACIHLNRTISDRKNWACCHQLVAAKAGPSPYFVCSIHTESGIFPVDFLRDAWPNISVNNTITRPAKTIIQVLNELDSPANWLWIDCLPALAVLAGADPGYDGFDVICTRVLKEESQDLRSREATLSYVKLSMEAAGFEMIAYDPERNPMIGHALFARSPKKQVNEADSVPSHHGFVFHHQDPLCEIAGFDIGRASADIIAAVQSTLSSADMPQAVSLAVHHAGYTPRECYHYLIGVACANLDNGDKMYGAGLLNEASHLLDKLPLGFKWDLVKATMKYGLVDDAYDILLSHLTHGSPLDPMNVAQIRQANMRWREKLLDSKGHGHEVLIAFMKRHAEHYRKSAGDAKPVLIEVGTTRENASGQGSTRRLMDFCLKESFHFITVDMDSANTEMAAAMFEENGLPFEAVHSKGEDYLATYNGRMDFVFLDAYDFDHGLHSERRQSRYEKFLGSRIDEEKCHIMHLDCAQSIVAKLSDHGVVCVDDTWLDDGMWVAKGTLAMPFLLGEGFKLLDVRNKSALLKK